MMGNAKRGPLKEGKWTDFLNLGLYAFLGLGLEVILLWFESAVFGFDFSRLSTRQMIMHWVATIVLWGATSFILYNISRKKYNYDLLEGRKSLGFINVAGALFLLLISLGISAWNWGGWKVAKEFLNLGPLKFTFQYLYYLMEALLILLLVAFGQKAGEIKFKRSDIPWGGLLTGLTWGLVHILTKGDLLVGIWGFGGGILYGIGYLILKKDLRYSYILISLMFIL